MICRLRVSVLPLVLILLPIVVQAQTRATLTREDVQSDLRRERQNFTRADQFQTTPFQRMVIDPQQIRPELFGLQPLELQKKSDQPFEFDVSLPFAYNTNILKKQENEIDDGHFNPALQLLWKRRYGDFKLSFLGNLNFDRYFSESAADGDEIYFSVTVAYSPPDATWSVYGGYRPTMDFTPIFKKLDITLHDIFVGALKSFAIPVQDSKALKVEIEGKITRRESDVPSSKSTAGTMSVKGSYVFNKPWSASVKPQLEVRGFDYKVDGTSRIDERVSIFTVVRWQLDSYMDVTFAPSFSKRFSNVPRARFTQWDVGPSVNFSWNF